MVPFVRRRDGRSTACGGRRAAAAAAATLLCCAAFAPSPTFGLVSFCRDGSPHSYTNAQSEVICQTEGLYNFPVIEDKTNGERLYDDLGESNSRRRFTAMDLDSALVAKYANFSDYAFFVEVLDMTETQLHHCCQICNIDCAQLRYVCPRTLVGESDDCTKKFNLESSCRFSETVLVVSARLLCIVKVAEDWIVPGDWSSSGFTLKTSPYSCPYRQLTKGRRYLIMATTTTPLYGGSDTLIGADMIVTVPKGKLPASYFVGINLEQPGYRYLLNTVTNATYCLSKSEIRKYSTAWQRLPDGLLVFLMAAMCAAVAAP